MTVEVAAKISGLLFWLIIITNIAANQFGYLTIGDLDKEADLQTINEDPQRFKIAFVLILIEHICIILLAIMLFIAFSPYSLILGMIWLVARTAEGVIQIINKRNYWRLLGIARRFAAGDNAERIVLNEARLRILESKHRNFTVSQILFAIGTLAYAILFVTYGPVPAVIAWFGIAAGSLYGVGNGINLVRSDFKVPSMIGGLLILIFEAALGGWLLLA